MRAIVYTLTLREPLLATSLQGDPNSSVSLAYVPGSLVRGALIQHYIREHGSQETFLGDAEAQRLFIRGSTRYLNAYPSADRSDVRCLPTPRSLLRRKHDEWDEPEGTSTIDVLDASHPECDSDARNEFEQSDTLKPLGRPFCASPEDTLYTYQPDRAIAVHIQRNTVKGRSVRGAANPADIGQTPNGAVFRYDALAPEQQFRGVVLVDNDADAVAVKEMLEKLATCWLGRSRSAQYGKTSVSDVGIVDDWRECGTDTGISTLAAGDQLHSITFLSDALLHDSTGQPVDGLDNNTLAAYLGLNAGDVEIDDEHSFSATIGQSGFNRYWKLPLTQEHALVAGSVISFRLKTPLSVDDAARIEQQGIGARRTEGFGRIAFNWRGEMKRRASKGDVAKARSSGTGTVQTAPASMLAKRMARQLHERKIEQYIIDFVKNHPVSNAPSNSQFGRLRVLVRQALPDADVAMVRAGFAAFKPTAKGQYERARLDNEPFDIWITKLLDNPDNVNTQFHSFQIEQIAGQTAEHDVKRVTLQLLAAVLAAPTRAERNPKEQQ